MTYDHVHTDDINGDAMHNDFAHSEKFISKPVLSQIIFEVLMLSFHFNSPFLVTFCAKPQPICL